MEGGREQGEEKGKESQTGSFTAGTGTERLRRCDKRQSKCICKCKRLLSLPEQPCSFSSPLYRPKLYLGYIKSNSQTSQSCRYVNSPGNSLKHCLGGQTVGANNNKVFTSFEWFRTTCSDHPNRLWSAGTDFQVAAFLSSAARLHRPQSRKRCSVVPSFTCPPPLRFGALWLFIIYIGFFLLTCVGLWLWFNIQQ